LNVETSEAVFERYERLEWSPTQAAKLYGRKVKECAHEQAGSVQFVHATPAAVRSEQLVVLSRKTL
jgi:hypothetical protein